VSRLKPAIDEVTGLTNWLNFYKRTNETSAGAEQQQQQERRAGAGGSR
jgi:hypothetical protein